MRLLLRTNALPPGAKSLRRFLYAISMVCLGFYLWYTLGGRLEQRALQARFQGALETLPSGEAPSGCSNGRTAQRRELRADPANADELSKSGMCARLGIPRLGIDVVVLDGVEESTLRRAAGHIPGTAAPGAPGNMGIAAHRDTFFQPLRDVRKGDLIQLTTLRGRESYRVVWMAVVNPSFVQALRSTRKQSLTLVTCFPFDYVGHAPERFIVRAERVPRGKDSMAFIRPVRFPLPESSANPAR